MTFEEALAALEGAGLVARDARQNPPMLVMGGVSSEEHYGIELYKRPFQIVYDAEGPGGYLGRTAHRGFLEGEKAGTLAEVVAWLIRERAEKPGT